MDKLDWTRDNWALVKDVISGEVEKARLCHNFIHPAKQPSLGENARSVRADRYDRATNTLDDVTYIPLVEVSAPVILTPAQATDKDLASALVLIRRAANRLARAHDEIVFTGQPKPDKLPPKADKLQMWAQWGSNNKGLGETDNVEWVTPVKDQTIGEALVGSVAQALVKLEDAGYIGSYVLILGQTLFKEANTPSKGSLVLPSDRMKNLMELEQGQH